MTPGSTNNRTIRTIVLFVIMFSLAAVFAGGEGTKCTVKSVDKSARKIVLDAGKNEGVRKGSKFNVYASVKSVELPFSGKKKLVEIHEPVAVLEIDSVELHESSGFYRLTKDEYADLVIVGCSCIQIQDNSDVNIAPVISNLLLAETKLVPGIIVSASLDVNDPNGDKLVYTWESDSVVFNMAKTSYPSNLLFLPLSFSGSTVSITITADDLKKNGKTAKSFNLAVGATDVSVYANSQLGEKRVFGRYFLGERSSVDNVAVLDNGNLVILDVNRQRSMFILTPRMTVIKRVEGLSRAVDICSSGNWIYVLEDSKVSVWNENGDKNREIFFDDTKLNSYIQQPARLCVRANGDVCIIDSRTMQVKVFDSQGNYRLSFGVSGQQPGGFVQPLSITEDRFGNLYILDGQRKDIQKFSPNYIVDTKPISVSELEVPTDLQYDFIKNTLLVLDYRGRVREINLEDSSKHTDVEVSAGVLSSFARTFDNYMYFAAESSGNSLLVRRSPDGQIGYYYDSRSTDAIDVACDDLGKIYLLCPSFRDGIVRVLNHDGWMVSSFGTSGTEQENLKDANKIAITPDGSRVYVLDDDSKVVEFGSNGSCRNTYAFNKIVDIAADAKGVLYVLEDEGVVTKCIDGTKEPYFKISDSKFAKKTELIEVANGGKDVFVASSRDYKILHYDGENTSIFPPQKSPFKRMSSMSATCKGFLFLLDGREGEISSLYLDNNTLNFGSRCSCKDAVAVGVNGFGEVVVVTKSDVRILRLPFLDFE